ncbi:hypothetical protein ACFX1Q_004150 [Malus domestica]
MSVDTDPFPTATISMVDARLPRDKGKEKAEDIPIPCVLNLNSRQHFNIDFRSNKPPTVLTGPTVVKPMTEYSTNEERGLEVLCKKCKANINVEPKDESPPVMIKQPTAATQRNVLDVGQRHGVFYKLGPKVQVEETPPVRRRLDFDAPFYDEDYYVRNSSSSESSKSQKTFKLPEPRDQRWYTYHSSKGVYTALSKSQKRRHQRIDCMARRRSAQEASSRKQLPTMMNDHLQLL